MKHQDFKLHQYFYNDYVGTTMVVKAINQNSIDAIFINANGDEVERRIFEAEYETCSINDYSPSTFDFESYVVSNIEGLKPYKALFVSFMVLAAIYMIKNILSL